MRQLIQNVLLFVTINAIIGCGSALVKLANNPKKPKQESSTSIKEWLSENNVPPYQVLTVVPDKFYTYAIYLNNYKPFIFKRGGTFVSYGYSNGVSCYKSFPEILMNLTPIDSLSSFPSDYIIHEYQVNAEKKKDTVHYDLNTIYKNLRDTNGDSISSEFINSNDYVVVLPFAIYQGNTIQVKDVKKYIKAILKNQRSKIQIVLLNFDKQEWWGEEWNKRIELTI
jgi:hypothetical protein